MNKDQFQTLLTDVENDIIDRDLYENSAKENYYELYNNYRKFLDNYYSLDEELLLCKNELNQTNKKIKKIKKSNENNCICNQYNKLYLFQLLIIILFFFLYYFKNHYTTNRST